MAITKAIGKNTVGDGNKMAVRLNNYYRSTHDLSYVWKNTQAVGAAHAVTAYLLYNGSASSSL